MRKKIFISTLLSMSLITALFAESEFPAAAEIKSISIEATKKLETELFNSEKGQKAYKEIMNFIETKVRNIASGGVYDSFNITYMNSRKMGYEEILKKLSAKEQILLKERIIEDLIKKGYKITENEYFNNPDSLYISVSW